MGNSQKSRKKAKIAPTTEVEIHHNRFVGLDGILEGNPNPEVEPEGDTSKNRALSALRNPYRRGSPRERTSAELNTRRKWRESK